MAKATDCPSTRKARFKAVSSDVNALAAAMEQTRADLETAQCRPREMSRYASRSALEASWRDSLAELRVTFDRADECAQALIRSIKAALALE